MSKLTDTSVSGNFTIDTLLLAGAGGGFQNMVIYTTGVANVFTFPTVLQTPGAKFKATIVGGGGGGGGTAAVAGQHGGGGGSGGVVVHFLTVVNNVYSLTYTVGTGGTATANAAGGTGANSTVTYNAVTYTAAGGGGGTTAVTPSIGGAGGAATGGTLNLPGSRGGSSGTQAATTNVYGFGGNPPLGFGQGGPSPGQASNGSIGSGYGSGGSGAMNSTVANLRAGSVGRPGIIIIEY